MKKLSISFLLLVFFIIGYSQESLVTDRPDQSESTSTVKKNHIQFETGGIYTKDVTSIGTLIKFGLFENAEIRVLANYDIQSNVNGFTPLSIGTKIKVTEEKRIIPSIAFLGALTIPSGIDEFNNNAIAPTLLIAAGNTLTDNLSLVYNIGTYWDGTSPYANGKYTTCLSWNPIKNLGIFGELFGDFNKNKSKNSLDFGAIYLITSNFQIDVSNGFCLNNDNYFLSTGFSIRL